MYCAARTTTNPVASSGKRSARSGRAIAPAARCCRVARESAPLVGKQARPQHAEPGVTGESLAIELILERLVRHAADEQRLAPGHVLSRVELSDRARRVTDGDAVRGHVARHD